MPIDRTFLGFERPALAAAAEYLLERFTRGPAADLDNVTVVVPGGRAGRRLIELLLAEAESRRLVLLPPQVVTGGELPERLYRPQKPFADELVEQLAWVHALRRIDRATLSQLMAELPEPDDLEAWMPLGQLLLRLHRELAADGLGFDEVGERAGSLPGFDEHRRWRVLRQVQREYLAALDAANLWDQQTARRYAVATHECRAAGPLVLIGTVDMNLSLRQMLDQVADHVTALVVAPAEWSDRFDEHGCLVPRAWENVVVPIRDDQITLADDPVDQAEAVARAIAHYGGRYRGNEIVIGAPDPRVVPQIQRQLSECGIAVRSGVGRALSDSAPYRLLGAAARWAETGRFVDFAALVRHADVERWLIEAGVPGDYLSELDEYHARHLPARLSDRWLGPPAERAGIERAHAAIARLVAPLSGQRRPGEWVEPVLGLLREVYARCELDRDDPRDAITIRSWESIRDAAAALSAIPDALAARGSAAEAIRSVLAKVAKTTVPPPADPEAVEVLGWLELPQDDAPALIVTSVNEGFVPEPAPADPFLPNRLRTHLGLFDNARRYARDAYNLAVLSHSGRELALVVARRDADGSPLAPSRLLFAAEPATVVARALRLFADRATERPPRPPLSGSLSATRLQSAFRIPRPPQIPGGAVESISVTAFRSYLACPFRFYLRHVLRLAPLCDTAEELDGAAFGSLLHEVLARFGREEIAASTNAEKIEAFLFDALEKCVRRSFGSQPLPPVSVQVLQLRARLSAFARWQALWAAEGWRIAHTEVPPTGAAAELLVDGLPMALSGRIDRIDVKHDTGAVVVLDYKSSSTVEEPDKSHRTRSGQWTDLQLPLYRHLARTLGIDGPVRLGYVALPKDARRVGALLAEWDAADLAAADETAGDVVRKIRRAEFWPPAEPSAGLLSEFAAICQEQVFDPQWDGHAEAPPSDSAEALPVAGPHWRRIRETLP